MIRYDENGQLVDDGLGWSDPNAIVDNPYSQTADLSAFDVAAKRVKKSVLHQDRLPIDLKDLPPDQQLELALRAEAKYKNDLSPKASLPVEQPDRTLLDKAIGQTGERYQFWPEKMVRSGFTAPHDAMTGELPTVDPVMGHTSPELIARAQDLAGMAGIAGPPMAAKAGLGMVGGKLPEIVTTPSGKQVKLTPVEGNPFVKPKNANGYLEEMANKYGADTDMAQWTPNERATYDSLIGGNSDIKGTKSLPERITDVYSKIRGGEFNGRATLADVRKELPDVPKAELDDALKQMQKDGQATLYRMDNGPEITKADHEAALKIGNEPRHILWMEKQPTFLSDTSISAPLSALAKRPNAMGFYSALERAVESAKLNKATPEQWLGYLRNQSGVKQEEISHVLGELPKEPITKEQINGIVGENKVQLGEKVYGSHKNWTLEDDVRLSELEQNRHRLTDAEETEFQRLVARENQATNEEGLNGGTPTMTKYQSYQLPGGKPGSYKETLLTLPEKRISGEDYVKSLKQKYGNDYQTQMNNEERKKVVDLFNGSGKGDNYISGHWDEPNVLAHIRTNDRTIEGQKSLHIEEIQSDWHQAGRKQGYKDGGTDYQKQLQPLYEKLSVSTEKDTGYKELLATIHGLEDKLANQERLVPNAPFKKSWDELALKRMIHKAALKNYDAVSWTPGEAQAARYDLSKHLSSVKADKRSDWTFNLSGIIKNTGDKHDFGSNIPANKLADFVGKDLAEKINKQDDNSSQMYRADDLKVGGEGMKAFYDKMLVDKISAITKKYGGKVEQKGIGEGENSWRASRFMKGLGREQEVAAASTKEELMKLLKGQKQLEGDGSFNGTIKQNTQPVHYLKLTPELKKKALEEGFALFSSTPILTQIPGNPFTDQKKKYKLTRVPHNPFEANQ